MIKIKLVVNAFIISSLISACGTGTTQPPAPQAKVEEVHVATTTATPIIVSTPASKTVPLVEPITKITQLPLHLDPKSIISKNRSVYFDYDSYTIKPDFMDTLKIHSEYLRLDAKIKIRIEGNADERGTGEYNIALGQKRADAVSKILTVLGVKPEQVETTSWGKEKPKALGHNESSWAQNRRADIQYVIK